MFHGIVCTSFHATQHTLSPQNHQTRSVLHLGSASRCETVCVFVCILPAKDMYCQSNSFRVPVKFEVGKRRLFLPAQCSHEIQFDYPALVFILLILCSFSLFASSFLFACTHFLSRVVREKKGEPIMDGTRSHSLPTVCFSRSSEICVSCPPSEG